MPYKDSITIKIRKNTHELLKKNKEQNGVGITFAIEKAVEEYFERRSEAKDNG